MRHAAEIGSILEQLILERGIQYEITFSKIIRCSNTGRVESSSCHGTASPGEGQTDTYSYPAGHAYTYSGS